MLSLYPTQTLGAPIPRIPSAIGNMLFCALANQIEQTNKRLLPEYGSGCQLPRDYKSLVSGIDEV